MHSITNSTVCEFDDCKVTASYGLLLSDKT